MTAIQHKTSAQRSADRIDTLLPQTQCGRCGYAGCRPYAEALAAGHSAPNRCPPGGDDLARELAAVLGVPYLPLDPSLGPPMLPARARIDEQTCIGCTLCIAACPVDAIVGAAKLMHTVIAERCTGCELCVPPCPVDCIALVPVGAPASREAMRESARRARERYSARTERLARERRAKARARVSAADAGLKKRETVARAIARARERLAGRAKRGE